MRAYKKVSKEVNWLDDVKCDICDESCVKKRFEYGEIHVECASVEAHWGFWSGKDTEEHSMEICESCYNWLIGLIKERGGRGPTVSYYM